MADPSARAHVPTLEDLRQWFERLPVAVAWVDDDGFAVNARLAFMLGRPAQDLTSLREVLDRIVGERTDEIVAEHASARASGRPTMFEGRLERSEGSDVPIDGCAIGGLWLFTERQRNGTAEPSYGEMLRMFLAIGDHVPGMLYQYREWPDGRRTFPFMTTGSQTIYGLSPAEIMEDASRAWERIHPDDLPDVQKTVARSKETLDVWRVVFRTLHRNAGLVWARGEATPQRLPDGSTLWHGYISDVTELQETELALQASRTLLDRAQRAGRVGAFVYAPDVGTVDLTPAGRDLLGVEHAPTLEDVLSRIPDAERDAFRDEWEEALRDRKGLSCVVRMRTHHDDPIWLHWMAEVEAETELRLVGTIRDVDEERTREDRMQRLATIIEQSPAIVVLTDPEHTIVDVNRAFEVTSGYDLQEVVGRKADFMARRGMRDAVFERGTATLEAGLTWEGTLENVRRDGSIFLERVTVSPIRDASGAITHYARLGQDLTEQRHLQERLSTLATSDPLTGLANRSYLLSRLSDAVEATRRYGGRIALLFLDVDGFGMINEALGQAAGDELLTEVAQRIRTSIRSADVAARIGGDEFAVILDRIDAIDDVAAAVTKLQGIVAGEPADVGGRSVPLSLSIGVALCPDDGASAEELTRFADAALHRAQKLGYGEVAYTTEALTDQLHDRLALVAELRRAVPRDEMRLVYQPRVDMADGRIVGMEALARWTSATLGEVSPGRFIPVAESTGVIATIGAWVVRTAIARIAAFRDEGVPLVPIAVNLSARQLGSDEIVEHVARTLQEFSVPAELFEVEITETAAMADVERAIERVRAFRSLGVHVSIDDFGTAYSSLGRLKELSAQTLKIDQSFVFGLGEDPDHPDAELDVGIVRGIIGIGRALGMQVIAEGVETVAQRDFLLAHECRIGQGYLFARPSEVDTVATWLRKGAALRGG